ncbi:MAG TPA: ADOP family duplicated permease [Gammaproteobacteria bacterium]|nr:ADOP family duplicated permease [Gammaproteobacteria bacterium]
MNRSHRASVARAASWLDSAWQDLRYAARSLAAQPSFTAMAMLALVLGIGLNTSVFTVINSLLTRPWDVPEPSRVVNIHDTRWFGLALTAARYLDDNSRTVEGVLATRTYRAELGGDDANAVARAAFVTANFFDVLHVGMALGRGFLPEDDLVGSAVTVGVISHALWVRDYAASPDVLGATVRLEGVPFTVIGVAAESFGGVDTERTDLWVPLATYPVVRATDPAASGLLTDPNRCCVDVSARLAPGVSRAEAQAELGALFLQYSTAIPREGAFARPPGEILLTGTAVLDHPTRRQLLAPTLAIVVTAFGSILLLACANVSNLLLARGTLRRREIAVRAALGAGRGRVMRQLLTESLVLAGLASAAGLALAATLPGVVLRFAGKLIPDNVHLSPDLRVLGYAIVVALVSAAAFGLVPALRATGTSVNDALKQQNGQVNPRARLRGVLLGTQVAISVLLLLAAALLVRGVDRARSLELGFDTSGVTALRVTLPPNAYDPAREAAFYDELVASLRAGGTPAAVSMLLPLGERWESTGFGARCNTDRIVTQRVSPAFFDVLRIPIVAGSTVRAGGASPESMVVDESLARACWGDANPIGRNVIILGRVHEVVGVVRDAQLQRIGMIQPTYYAPFVPDGNLVSGPAFVLVPSAFAAGAAARVRQLEPRAAAEPIPLHEQVERSLGTSANVARIAGALGLLALVLATVGVYGVISYSVERQRREIGVRMALGARPHEITAMVLRVNGRAVAVGSIVGVVLAAVASQVLRSRLYGLSPLDPVAYLAVVGLLALAALAASVLPARRASRTDPATVLHQD